MKTKNNSVSVFFPCYNDEKTIGKLVETALKILPQLTNNFEVIVIDDGSSDKSREVLKTLKKKHKRFKYVFHKKNKGYGGALQSGFKTATKELVFYTDGDGQYDVSELPILYQLMTKDVNFINGIKMERKDFKYRIVMGNLYAMIMRWLFLLPIIDVDCDFRLIRRSLLKKIDFDSNSGAVCVELVKKAQKAGGKFRQVSVHHYPRQFGQSQFFKLDRLIKTAEEIGRLWWRLMMAKDK